MHTATPPVEPRAAWTPTHRITLAVILVAALALRCTDLVESVWFDELWSTRVRLESPYAVALTCLRDNHPPAYTTFIYLWTLVFGDGEVAIRLPSVAASLATIALTAHLGRELVSPWTGLVAAALLAVSPPQVWYAQEARHYGLWLTCVTGAALTAARILRDGTRPWRSWLHAACLWTALLMHFYSLAYAGLLLLATLRRRTPGERRLFLISALGVAAVAAFLVVKVATGMLETSSSHLRPFGPFALVLTWFGWFPTGHAVWRFGLWEADLGVYGDLPWMALTHLTLAFVLALGVRAAWRRAPTPQLRGWLCFPLAVPLLLAALAVLGHSHTFVERSTITGQPFVYLLLAAGLTSLPRVPERIALGAAVATITGAGLVAFLRSDGPTVHKPNPDWRAAAARLRNEPELPAVILTASPADALAYYGDEFRIVRRGTGTPGRLETKALELGLARPAPTSRARFPIHRFGENEDRLHDLTAAPVERVYVVENRVWADRIDELHARMAEHPRFEPVHDIEVAHLRIRVYMPRR